MGYLIIISDSMVSTFKAAHKQIDRRIPVIVGALVISPLCFLSQRTLAITSAFGVFSNCFVVFAVVFNYYVVPPQADKVCPTARTSSKTYDKSLFEKICYGLRLSVFRGRRCGGSM